MSIQVTGNEHQARALTLPEVRKVRAADGDDSDVLALSMSYGISVDEARVWFETVPAGTAMAAIAEVMAESGLAEGAQKSG